MQAVGSQRIAVVSSGFGNQQERFSSSMSVHLSPCLKDPGSPTFKVEHLRADEQEILSHSSFASLREPSLLQCNSPAADAQPSSRAGSPEAAAELPAAVAPSFPTAAAAGAPRCTAETEQQDVPRRMLKPSTLRHSAAAAAVCIRAIVSAASVPVSGCCLPDYAPTSLPMHQPANIAAAAAAYDMRRCASAVQLTPHRRVLLPSATPLAQRHAHTAVPAAAGTPAICYTAPVVQQPLLVNTAPGAVAGVAAATAAAAAGLSVGTMSAATQQLDASRAELLQQLPAWVLEQPTLNPLLTGKAKAKAVAMAKFKAAAAADAAAECLASAAEDGVKQSAQQLQRQLHGVAVDDHLAGSSEEEEVGITELLFTLWPAKIKPGAADSEGNRANTHHHIGKILRRTFGDAWLVPGALTVEQFCKWMSKKYCYTNGGRWHTLRIDMLCWLLFGPEGHLGSAPWPTNKCRKPRPAMHYLRVLLSYVAGNLAYEEIAQCYKLKRKQKGPGFTIVFLQDNMEELLRVKILQLKMPLRPLQQPPTGAAAAAAAAGPCVSLLHSSQVSSGTGFEQASRQHGSAAAAAAAASETQQIWDKHATQAAAAQLLLPPPWWLAAQGNCNAAAASADATGDVLLLEKYFLRHAFDDLAKDDGADGAAGLDGNSLAGNSGAEGCEDGAALGDVFNSEPDEAAAEHQERASQGAAAAVGPLYGAEDDDGRLDVAQGPGSRRKRVRRSNGMCSSDAPGCRAGEQEKAAAAAEEEGGETVEGQRAGQRKKRPRRRSMHYSEEAGQEAGEQVAAAAAAAAVAAEDDEGKAAAAAASEENDGEVVTRGAWQRRKRVRSSGRGGSSGYRSSEAA